MTSNNSQIMSNKDIHGAYYNRVMSKEFVDLMKTQYQWLITFVKRTPELDFQTGYDQKANKSWFSVYRGTSRILKFTYNGNSKKTNPIEKVTIDADPSYKHHAPQIFEEHRLDEKILAEYLSAVNKDTAYDSYYIDSKEEKKEGYYQTRIARRYTFENKQEDEFVIFDKELVIGFIDSNYRDEWNEKYVLNEQNAALEKFKNEAKIKLKKPLPLKINTDFGEFDFMGIDWKGNLIIMELKSEDKKGLSPIQVACYDKQFKRLLQEDSDNHLYKTIIGMIEQKIDMGLINLPKGRSLPTSLTRKIKKYIIIGNEENVSPEISNRFALAKEVFLGKDLEVYTCTADGTLVQSEKFK